MLRLDHGDTAIPDSRHQIRSLRHHGRYLKYVLIEMAEEMQKQSARTADVAVRYTVKNTNFHQLTSLVLFLPVRRERTNRVSSERRDAVAIAYTAAPINTDNTVCKR